MKVSHRACQIRKTRSNRGASTILVALSAMLLIGLLALALQTMIMLNGSQEMKNSVDAGVLNIAKGALTRKVIATQNSKYDDMADCNGCIELTNVNRVWGKAYLINANAQEMQESNFAKPDISSGNGRQAWGNAQQINDALLAQLLQKNWADTSFRQLSRAKGAKILGSNGNVVPSYADRLDVAYLYRGEESNIWYDPKEIPGSVKTSGITHGKSLYLQGYNPMLANGLPFCFTTFHADEAPHLVSLDTFRQWQGTVNGAKAKPLPNSFSHSGFTDGRIPLTAAAASVVNPIVSYPLALTRAYVTIKIAHIANWYVQKKLVNTTPYSPASLASGKIWGAKSIALKSPASGILNGYSSLGMEYAKTMQPSSVLAVIMTMPGQHELMFQRLTQRLKEMVPGTTEGEVKTLLDEIVYPGNATNYKLIIYNNVPCSGQPKSLRTFASYDTSDGEEESSGGKNVGPIPNFIGLVPYDAEGLDKKLFDETPLECPSASYSNIIGPYPTDDHSVRVTGVENWCPATGYNYDLGTFTITRTTNVVFTGLPPSQSQ